MAQIILDVPLVKYEEVKKFITYLNQLRQTHSDVSICESLLEAVEREEISPATFAAFLPWCRTPDTIILCLNNPFSRRIRLVSIKRFGKILSNPHKWFILWNLIGGMDGLVDLLAKMSVTEVKAFAKAIGHCRGQSVVPERDRAIESLVRALIPSHYPESMVKRCDKRPIQKHYAHMIAACSSDFVARLLDSQDQSNPLYQHLSTKRLLRTHGEILQKRVVDAIFSQGKRDTNFGENLAAFCYTQPPEPGPYPGVSASMIFSMNMLRMRLEGNASTDWPSQVSEAAIFSRLLDRCIRKKLPPAKLRNIFSLGLSLLDRYPRLHPAFKANNLWNELIDRWGKSAEAYTDLLVRAIHLGLGGSSNAICKNVMSISNKLKLSAKRTWELLRLYCLHIPKESSVVVDLDTSTDLKPIGQQPWSSELFYKLNKKQALRLLKNLQTSFPHDNFVQGPHGSLLSGNSGAGKQRNVILLSIMLQRDSLEVQSKVRTTVDELRKKSATSREQSERANFATAALQHATASGNLTLYGETVTWLQRYARDPLTLREVLRKTAVMTIESIALLSGIPDPLPLDMTLREVVTNIQRANAILMTFNEIMLIAKREPSFQEYDWDGVSSLFSTAIRRRADHALAVQKQLLASDAEIYAALSGDTLAMLGIVEFKTLHEAYNSIQALITRLPPTALAETAHSILAAETQNRQSDRHRVDYTLEQVSYSTLIKVTECDNPELAQRLVLETILGRPDASSWHRSFLSPAFMKSLPSKQAHDMLLAFATAIGEKLEEQSYVKVGAAAPAPSAPASSIVKVTTIKYLAQLLDNAEFISVDASIEVLVEIFKASTHRDIRLATLDSLLSLLNALCTGADNKWRSNPLIEKIMEALETVIPVVGSIDERRPPREGDWNESRETGKLLGVSEIENSGLPPLLGALMYAPSGARYTGLKAMRSEFVSRFFLPIYKLSQQSQHKWSILFLAKHQAGFEASELPPTPVRFQMCDYLVRNFADLIPRTVLNDYNKYIIMTIACPANIQAFNGRLKKNPELLESTEVQYWLSLFNKGVKSDNDLGTYVLLKMVYDKHIQTALPDGITNDAVQGMIVSHSALLLDNYNENLDIWNNFTQSLHHPCKANNPHRDDDEIRSLATVWQKTGRVIVARIIEEVQDRKSLFRAQRNLTILPSTNILHHYLLPYPLFPSASEVDGECKLFASELEKQLAKHLDGDVNMLRWPRVTEDAKTVSKLLNTNDERLRVASFIGKLTRDGGQKSSALNFVKVRLATALLEDARELLRKLKKEEGAEINQRDKLIVTLRRNMLEWNVHPDEGIREESGDWTKRNGKMLDKV